MEVKVNLELVNAILAYLGKKAFEEVEPLVNAIRHQVAPQLPSQEEIEAAAASEASETE